MPRPARTQAALDHLRRFVDIPAGMVLVTMKDGGQVRGVIMKETLQKSADGLQQGITLVDESGAEHELDLLDVWHVDKSEATEEMRAVLRKRGMLSE